MTAKPAILLVDDEPDILHSLVGLLRRDFEVHLAESGHEALHILAEHTIHVVMTDQRMPEMTGDQLVREVRNRHPETSRILFTGYADIKSVIEAINHGGLYRYVTKPWDPDDLVELLREAATAYNKAHAEQQLKDELKNLIAWVHQVTPPEGANAAVNGEQLDGLRQSCQRLEQLLAEARGSDKGA